MRADHVYLRRIRANRNIDGSPIIPEVMLNESFYNLHHVRNHTRDIADEFVYRPTVRKGPRYCIMGAGLYQTVCGQVTGDWVPDSFFYWEALRKKPSEKRRSRRKTIPEGAGYGDYHGNFTAELFFEAYFLRKH